MMGSWVTMNGCARRGAARDAVPAEREVGGYRRTTSFRTRRSQLSAAQQRTWERLWPELGRIAVPGDEGPPNRWTPRPGSAATPRWYSKSVVAQELPH